MAFNKAFLVLAVLGMFVLAGVANAKAEVAQGRHI